MPNKKTTIRTNTTPDSIKEISLKTVTFQELWDAYPLGDPYDDPDGQYENQCAIRLSVTLHRVGIEMKSFSEKIVKPAQQNVPLGRLLVDGKPTATRADELAQWLKLRPFATLPPAQDVTGPEWEDKVRGRTGIIAFSKYWRREGEALHDASGGHIDLWNGSRLTVSSAHNAISTYGRMVGVDAFLPNTRVGWSDVGRSKQILFWEIK